MTGSTHPDSARSHGRNVDLLRLTGQKQCIKISVLLATAALKSVKIDTHVGGASASGVS